MSYTNRAGKNITQAWGKVQATIYATVSAGDLLAYDSSNYGYKLAVEASSLPAIMVACEDGVSGDVIYVASAVEFTTTPTESSGVWTAVVLAATADVGKALYQSTAGIASDTAGTTMAQYVGHILSTTRAMLMPQQSLTGASATYTGNVAVTGAVTVSSTMTVALAGTFSSALTVTRTLTCSSSVAVTVAVAASTLNVQTINTSNIVAQGAIGTSGAVTASTISVQTVTCASAVTTSTLNTQALAATSAISASTISVQTINTSNIVAQGAIGTSGAITASTISVQAANFASGVTHGTSAGVADNINIWGATAAPSSVATLRWVATTLTLYGSSGEATVCNFAAFDCGSASGHTCSLTITTSGQVLTFSGGILTHTP